MKLTTLLILLSIAISSCSNPYYVLTDDELQGTVITSRSGVYKARIKVLANSNCKTKLALHFGNTPYRLNVDNELDTILQMDWYAKPMRFKAEYDSCLAEPPKIAVKFIDKIFGVF